MDCVSRRGRVLSGQSSGPGFEIRYDHYLDLFLGSPEFKSSAGQLGFLTMLCLLELFFQLFVCTRTCTINIAEITNNIYLHFSEAGL